MRNMQQRGDVTPHVHFNVLPANTTASQVYRNTHSSAFVSLPRLCAPDVDLLHPIWIFKKQIGGTYDARKQEHQS